MFLAARRRRKRKLQEMEAENRVLRWCPMSVVPDLHGSGPLLNSRLWSNRRKEPFLEDLVTIMSACPSEDPDPTPVDSPLSSGVSKETDLRGAFRGGCGMYPARRSFVAALPPLLLSTMSKEAESPTSIGRGHSPIAYSAACPSGVDSYSPSSTDAISPICRGPIFHPPAPHSPSRNSQAHEYSPESPHTRPLLPVPQPPKQHIERPPLPRSPSQRGPSSLLALGEYGSHQRFTTQLPLPPANPLPPLPPSHATRFGPSSSSAWNPPPMQHPVLPPSIGSSQLSATWRGDSGRPLPNPPAREPPPPPTGPRRVFQQQPLAPTIDILELESTTKNPQFPATLPTPLSQVLESLILS